MEKKSYLKRIAYFFLISHGIPLLITLLCIMGEGSFYISNPLYGKFIYVGLLSPLLAVFYIMSKFYSKKDRKNYWLSAIDFKRIPIKWYLIIFTFPILVRLVGSILDFLIISNSFKFSFSPEMNIIYAIILLFFGPVPEELAWRGVVLPDLQKEFGFKIAVVFLGFMWAIWHIPLFLVEGTYQNQLGLFTPLFWNFMLGVIFTSVVYGVIYNETQKSILAVILFHYLVNLIGETFIMTSSAQIITTVLRGVVAIAILVFYNKKRFHFSIYYNKMNK